MDEKPQVRKRNFAVIYILVSIIVGIVLVFVFQFTKVSVTHPVGKKLPPENFHVENAPIDSLKGEIISMSGDINWQSRIATESVPLTSIVPIQQGESIETKKNGIIKIPFANALVLTVFPDTFVGFSQTLPLNVVLSQPQGIISVTKTGKIPISIRALGALINIEEGESLITVDNENDKIKLTVDIGKTTIAFNDKDYISNIVSVSEGHILIFDNTSRTYVLR